MAKRVGPTRRVNSGSGHVYYLDGKKLTGRGVTTLLGNGFPKGGLQYWAAGEVASCALNERDLWEPLAERDSQAAWDYLKQAPFRDRDKAAKRGTEVHRLAERLQAGEEVQVPDELVGHVDAYLQFRDEWQPDDEIVEGVVVNRTRRYLGTFDSIATLPGFAAACKRIGMNVAGDRVLYDVKTTRKADVYPDTALQLAAYRHAETYIPDLDGLADEAPMPQVDGCAVLHLSADGYQLIPVDAGERAFRQFLYVVQTAEFLGTWKEPGWGPGLVGSAIAAPALEGSAQ